MRNGLLSPKALRLPPWPWVSPWGEIQTRTLTVLGRLNTRELVLGALTLQLMISLLGLTMFLWPAWEKWSAQRVGLRAAEVKYQKLLENMAVEQPVNASYQKLPAEAFGTDSDQITLSQFLQGLEAAARRPRLAVVSMKPAAPVVESGIRVFPVKLSVNGPLADVTQFVAALVAGPQIVSLDSFALRGLPGGGAVDATLSIRLLKLQHAAGRPGATQPATAPSSEATHAR